MQDAIPLKKLMIITVRRTSCHTTMHKGVPKANSENIFGAQEMKSHSWVAQE